MNRKKTGNEIIISPAKNILDNKTAEKILSYTNSKEKIGIDMKEIESIKSARFIEGLIENKFKLFNLKSEVLAYLAIVLKDGFLKSYINYEDFSYSKRELIKRRFLVV